MSNPWWPLAVKLDSGPVEPGAEYVFPYYVECSTRLHRMMFEGDSYSFQLISMKCSEQEMIYGPSSVGVPTHVFSQLPLPLGDIRLNKGDTVRVTVKNVTLGVAKLRLVIGGLEYHGK